VERPPRYARSHGYANDLWTTPRIASVIAYEFGVDYHPTHGSRILPDLGWSCQKPERRALERNRGGDRSLTRSDGNSRVEIPPNRPTAQRGRSSPQRTGLGGITVCS